MVIWQDEGGQWCGCLKSDGDGDTDFVGPRPWRMNVIDALRMAYEGTTE